MMLQALRGRRVNPAGEPDPGFAGLGKARVAFPGSLSSQANDVLFCPDGKILVVARVEMSGACISAWRGSMPTARWMPRSVTAAAW